MPERRIPNDLGIYRLSEPGHDNSERRHQRAGGPPNRGNPQDRGRGRDAAHQRRGRRLMRSRSEEHTSELQSHLNLVCRLLLEKKKKKKEKKKIRSKEMCD